MFTAIVSRWTPSSPTGRITASTRGGRSAISSRSVPNRSRRWNGCATFPACGSCGATPTGTSCRARARHPHADDVERDPTLRPLFLAVEASFAWTRAQMGTADIAWLARASGPTAHGAPRRDPAARHPRLPAVRRRPRHHARARRSCSSPRCSPAPTADVICGGHTHQATDRQLGATRAINLGSVSNPITSDLRASYVIVDDDPSGHRITAPARRLRPRRGRRRASARRAIPRRSTSRASSAATRSVIPRFDRERRRTTTERRVFPCRTGPSKSPPSQPRWAPSGW